MIGENSLDSLILLFQIVSVTEYLSHESFNP